MGKFYVKGTRIKKTGITELYTLHDICDILNKQDQQLQTDNDTILELKQLLLECSREFRKYDGRKLFDLDYIVFASILNKINELLDPK